MSMCAQAPPCQYVLVQLTPVLLQRLTCSTSHTPHELHSVPKAKGVAGASGISSCLEKTLDRSSNKPTNQHSNHPSIHPPFHLPIHPPTHPLLHLPIHTSIYPSHQSFLYSANIKQALFLERWESVQRILYLSSSTCQA